jgi:hypothetical protein
MRSFKSVSVLTLSLLAFAAGCSASPQSDVSTSSDDLRGPGSAATDARTPELGNDVSIVEQSKISLADGVAAASKNGAVIEAKFELADDGKSLSLSLYPAGKGLQMDAERNLFQELSGDPTADQFAGSLEVFADQEHLTRSARDLTLVQLSTVSLSDAIDQASWDGNVFWAIPTIRHGRAGYGVYTENDGRQHYRFIDGQGSSASTAHCLREIAGGPGSAATDARAPELPDLSVLATSKITMAAALAQTEATNGPAIEAKFEPDDSGNLSLSIYPVKDISLDAERSKLGELSGDPTGATYAPDYAEFTVPDVEHLTKASRDLTLVQTSSLTLRQAVDAAQRAMPGGFVYWAIPTIRDTRAGYGVYIYGADKKAHYFFVS